MEVKGLKKDRIKDVQHFCEPCENIGKHNQANCYCVVCTEYFCQICADVHRGSKLSMHHELLIGSEMPTRPPPSDTKSLLLTDVCKFHQKTSELIKFFCSTHDNVICGDCLATEHRSCDVDFIVDIAKGFQGSEYYTHFNESMIRIGGKLKNAQEILQDILKNSAEDKLEVLNEMKKLKEELVAYFEERERELTNEISALAEDANKVVESNLTKVSESRNTLETVGGDIECKTDLPNQLFISTKQNKPVLDDLEKSIDTILTESMSIRKKYALEPDQNIIQLLKDKNPIWTLSYEALAPSDTQTYVKQETGQLSKGSTEELLKPPTQDLSKTPTQELSKTPAQDLSEEPTKDVSKAPIQEPSKNASTQETSKATAQGPSKEKSNFVQKIWHNIRKPATDDNGPTHLVGNVGTEHRRLTLLSRNLSLKRICEIDGYSKEDRWDAQITGIVLLSPEKLAITDMYNKTVKTVELLGRKVVTQFSMLGDPWDLTCLSDSRLAVTYHIFKMMMTLKMKNEKLLPCGMLRMPGNFYGVDCNADRLAVIYGQSVNIMDINGTVHQVIERNDTNLIRGCEGYVMFTHTGQEVFVTCEDDCVRKLSLDGEVLGTYTNNELKYPSGMAVTTGGDLFVCGKESHTVHVVGKDGTMRTLLSAQNCLNCPRALCLDEGARVLYVSHRGSGTRDELLVLKIE